MAGSGGGQGRGVRAVLAEAGGDGGVLRSGGRAARRSDSGGVAGGFCRVARGR